MEKFKLKKLLKKIEHEILSGQDKIDEIEVSAYGLNRAGLELAGFVDYHKHSNHKRGVFLSNKEYSYMQQFDYETRVEKYKKLIETNAPFIMITPKFKDDVIIEVAIKMNYPIIRLKSFDTSELIHKILNEYDNFLGATSEVHGSLITVYGKGVLLIGESGIGKSEVILDLVRFNHLFVGDDRIILQNKFGKVYAKGHPILKNLIEVRGLGIFDLSKTDGAKVIVEETQLDLIIELFPFKDNNIDNSERLGAGNDFLEMLGVNIPHLKIPVASSKNITNIIETAVANLKNKLAGNEVDVIELINSRIQGDHE